MSDDPADFFAPPPFDPATARATLARALRDLKLAERNGAFELNGQPVVKARVEGALLKLDVAKKPVALARLGARGGAPTTPSCGASSTT